MRVYGLKNCDTCRKAIRSLGGAGRNAVLVDVRENPLSESDRLRFAAAFGEALVNRRSKTWASLSAADRALPLAGLIARHPAAMKRPVIETQGRLYLGWGPEVLAALLE